MEIPLKRFYMPGFVIRATCPTCGREVVQDLGDDYLSYPETGELTRYMYCDADDGGAPHEFNVRVRLVVTLEPVEGCTVEYTPDDEENP